GDLSPSVHRATIVEDPDGVAVVEAPGRRVNGIDPQAWLRIGLGERRQSPAVIVERVEMGQRAALAEEQGIPRGALRVAGCILGHRLPYRADRGPELRCALRGEIDPVRRRRDV